MLIGMMKCKDDDVCSVAATALDVLIDVSIGVCGDVQDGMPVDLNKTVVLHDADYSGEEEYRASHVASSIPYSPFDSLSLSD